MNVVVTSEELAGNSGGDSGIHDSLSYSTEACSFTETAPAAPTSTSTTTDTTGGTGGVVDSTVDGDTGSTTGTGN